MYPLTLLKTVRDRYLKSSVLKSIVHVKKYASFQLYRTYFAGVFGKKYNGHQVHKQTSLIFLNQTV